ncbi:hypothetical protein PR202_gb06677 [Eleusine coracana subsp. coracana]|uniref:non-specific serine/threonine protein kinase n=1 Tax=Eleusine coracana subsp. coracana TaxID=191504 RepID=A0AAV5EA17_ELECO|nr:hypothetical protein QOZ80_2BG0160680 [Eleusine coracana subsp. coracana]GJN19400.1 hypothetical protein PR202_gb06677 [Eleusine coracana subsp. coracana]
MTRPTVLLHFLVVVFLTCSCTTPQSTMAQTDAVELATLLKLKTDWGSPSALSSWSSENSTYCKWSGIICNSNGHVTTLSFHNFHIAHPIPASICSLNDLSHLDLSYNNLTGDFPTALYNCSALQFLDLSNNEFSGALPADIDKLSPGTMEHLNLSSNGFTGKVPSGIAEFPKLKSLVLDTNSFNGSYPATAISNLVSLETLTLASNPFMPGPVPEEFSKLTKLKTLWLSGMNLTGVIPDSLSALTELTLLDLSQNKLHGEIPGWVWNHQKLQCLYLFANNFIGGIGPSINATNMIELDLSTNSLTEPIPDAIGNMTNLKLLFLYFNKIAGPIPASVGQLPNLRDLRLFNNKLKGPLPPELGKHSPLGNLEVSHNMLSGTVPDTLCSNKKLYDLVLFNNSFSGEFPASLGECDTLDNIMLYNNHFTGVFPERVWWAFPKLTNVMIQNNSFTGTLPTAVSSNISRIEMGNNRFSGPVPSSAPGLNAFKAENNRFSAALPTNMSGLANLTDLDLSGNQISGSIPSSILSLRRMTSLNLSGNQLSGDIPAAIGSLPVLNILDLSDNQLTGSIPREFNNLRLSFLNLSSNELAGEVPSSLQNQAYEGAFLRNPGLCATVVDLNLNIRACDGYTRGRNDQMSTGLTILFSVLAGATFIGVVGCVVILGKKKRRQHDTTAWKMTPFRKLIDFTERDVVTGLREEDVIGSGGSGKVYRVKLAPSGTAVAVKRLNKGGSGKSDEKLEREFDSEVQILGDIRHANIVSLLCCVSSDEGDRLLVYEYMENGSLDRWLHRRDAGLAPLDWPTRLGVAIDAARGLSYMHHECARPVMHRDVKSSNILLDPGFRAKVADFGLARILVKSGEPESVSAVGGTFGYMAPECGRGVKVNEKVDVYSFGVVLLELATGRVANDGGAEWCLVEWAWRRYKAGDPLQDVVDATVRDRDAAFVQDAVAVFVLGVICTGDDAASRPSMKQVLQQLVRYDRTASVAGACQVDGCEDGDVKRAELTAGKKAAAAKSSVDDGRAYWDGDEESGSFVAHPA